MMITKAIIAIYTFLLLIFIVASCADYQTNSSATNNWVIITSSPKIYYTHDAINGVGIWKDYSSGSFFIIPDNEYLK